MTTLFVAAGGGGDAVGILLARRILGPGADGPAFIATCAWERLIIDPVPGPRPRSGFSNLIDHGPVAQITPASETIPAGRSSLPRLSADADVRLFLLDLSDGAITLGNQLAAAADACQAERLVVVDVGGDAIATGDEPGLLSPLCDSLTLAASFRTNLQVTLAVIGPGVDGELSETDVLGRLTQLAADLVGHVEPRDVDTVDSVLTWHPTEASAIVAAAALGERGKVAMRRGGSPTPMTEHSTEIWTLTPSLTDLPLAELLVETSSLDHAAALVGAVCTNEIDYEAQKALSLADETTTPAPAEQLAAAVAAGATHITLRRAREVTGSMTPADVYGKLGLTPSQSTLLRLHDLTARRPSTGNENA